MFEVTQLVLGITWLGRGRSVRRDDFWVWRIVKSLTLSSQFLVQVKDKKSNERPVPLKTPKGTGPKVTLFCGLIMEQVGGRHLSLLQQRSGCTPAVVSDMSQWIATQKCMWDFLSPLYPWEVQKGPVVPVTFLWRLLLSILSNCSVKLEWSGEMCVKQTLHLWQKTLYLFHPHILHSSSQKFAIILKRRLQIRLTQLWFSVGWDYFVLIFFSISFNLVDHSRLVYKSWSWTTHPFPFTFHLLVLSLLILDSWPYMPVWCRHLPLSLCQSHFFLQGTPLSPLGHMDFDLLPSVQLF